MIVENVNYIAILACGFAAMVVGFIWYSKKVFGKTWMKEAGISESQIKEANKNMAALYIPMFIGALVEACVLSALLSITGAADYISAAQIAFWVWLGFIATALLGAVLFEGKSWTYYTINAGYNLVTLVVMSAVLVTIK